MRVNWGVYDIANQAFDAKQSTIARQKLASYPPDYTIEITRNAGGTLEFDRAAEMIELGYIKAPKSLNQVAKEFLDTSREGDGQRWNVAAE